MEKALIQEALGEKVVAITTLSGGDIAHAQKVETQNATYFVKSASFPSAKQLFEKELLGLQAIAETNTIGTPTVVGTFDYDGTSCLILEFIQTKQADEIDFQAFGRLLAKFHCAGKKAVFGFETSNFIGKLPQTNATNKNWPSFYVSQRLTPQLEMALQSGNIAKETIPPETRMIRICEDLFGDVVPSLLHGDLWSGNYLISERGHPYLIDPSVYYGHNEVDLAMTKLFGGFSGSFYGAYHEIIPPHPNQKELTEIYQLYYLLVHLNLFGTSYLNSVLRILEKYFS